MVKLNKKQKLELGLELLLDRVPLNSGKVHDIKYIQFNCNTCNAVLRTNKGILKTHLIHPNSNRERKKERIEDFMNGVSHLSILSNIFPESYTPIRDFREIKPDKSNEKYFNLFPYVPEKIMFTITDEVKGPNLGDKKSLGLPINEKLRILIELGEIIDYSHKMGIINCDLKPENVILREREGEYHPVLFDTESFRYRRESLTVVTPAYLNPKTANAYYRQENNEILSARTINDSMTAYEDLDKFAFLISAYEFINGNHPRNNGVNSDKNAFELAKKRIKVDRGVNYQAFFQNAFDGRYKNMSQVLKKLKRIEKDIKKAA